MLEQHEGNQTTDFPEEAGGGAALAVANSPVADGHDACSPQAADVVKPVDGPAEEVVQEEPSSVSHEDQARLVKKVIAALLPQLETIASTLHTSVDQRFSNILTSPEFMDTLTANVLRNSLDAINFRAQHKADDQQYVVNTRYMPGSYRVMFRGDGQLIAQQQLRTAAEQNLPHDGWEEAPVMHHEQGADAIRTILNAAGVEPDRYYYLITKRQLADYTRSATQNLEKARSELGE